MIRGIGPAWGWRQVPEGLGLRIERLAVRGYLARHLASLYSTNQGVAAVAGDLMACRPTAWQ